MFAHLSIPLGIIVGLLASFVQSLGLTVQRKSHVLNQALPEHRQCVEHRRPLWLIGFAIFISSNILGSLVQIASLPVVILAPLGAVSLLWNAFFARFILGDVFSPWMILATILIAGGAILIAFFGIVPEPTRSLEDLLHLFRRPAFIAYFSILGFIVIFCLAITHIAEFSLSRRIDKSCPSDSSSADLSPSSTNIHLPTHASDTTPVISNAIDDSLATERTPLLDRKAGSTSPSSESINPTLRSINRTRLLLAISFASFSGIISGMCLLFAKSGVELLLLTLTGNNQFWRWEAWVLVLGLILFALLQLWYLHKALILADPTLVCPSAFCFYNLSSIVNGLVYFDQFSLIPPVHLGLVILGIFILLGGVWVVSIHSGGGGVDVGTWNEGDDFSCEESMLLPGSEDIGGNREAAAASMAEQPVCKTTNHRVRPQMSSVAMERETLSESNIPTATSPQTTGSDLDDLSSLPPVPTTESRHPRLYTQLYSTPQGPSHRSHSARRELTTDVHQSPTSMQTGNLRTASHPYSSYSPASHQSPHGTVSTLGAGFQIGLSPLSPGFTIVPLDRRRPSGMGLSGRPSLADVANDIIISLRETERRRTVSEGEPTRRPGNGVQDAARNNEAAVGEEDNEGVDEGDIDETRDQSKSRRRWRWIRKVFTGKG
ncbi:hypothetical protein BYT27DRAFT_7338106 [Phlegmacium glaucopus]|nr:hypothetical protein BYT27DRAFT_7338106 [Phlegmacium glaucopus]